MLNINGLHYHRHIPVYIFHGGGNLGVAHQILKRLHRVALANLTLNTSRLANAKAPSQSG
jgi:hypothetical protein